SKQTTLLAKCQREFELNLVWSGFRSIAFHPYCPREPNGMFTYSSHPKPVEIRKYRDLPDPNHLQYGNIMYDRRVVRGNINGQQVISKNNQSDPGMQQRQQAYRRRALARKQAKDQLKTKTPEAIQGRQHVEVQTGETLWLKSFSHVLLNPANKLLSLLFPDSFLEELSNIIQVNEIDCQTDDFLDKPSTPLFVPAKSGVDVETQIEEGDTDSDYRINSASSKYMYPLQLFDFDLEVQPVLEVLVGKTIEQSLLEVMEEEELACLRTQQRVFQELRNNELAEVQRLEEQERRYREEKERRVAQQREVLKKEQETAEKIAARVFSQQYLAGLLPAVFTALRNHGYFYDPVEKGEPLQLSLFYQKRALLLYECLRGGFSVAYISVNFIPWLIGEVNNQLDKRYAAREVLD
ncbi:hypothetical protein CCH79_00000474, partial [Gambusia affinis]